MGGDRNSVVGDDWPLVDPAWPHRRLRILVRVDWPPPSAPVAAEDGGGDCAAGAGAGWVEGPGWDDRFSSLGIRENRLYLVSFGKLPVWRFTRPDKTR